MYRIVQKRNYLFALSLILLIPGVIGYMVWGLRLGIDFTGGTLVRLEIPSAPGIDRIEAVVRSSNLGPTSVQLGSSNSQYLLRLPYLTNDQRQQLQTDVQQTFPDGAVDSFETIGPTIGRELQQRAVVAVTLVVLAIIVYVTWAFRRVSIGPVPSWAYGAATLVALVHDVFMVVGSFAILGHFFGIEVNALFVTALLTVLGFSVHDTIVVFDRIRERLRMSSATTYEEIVNESLNQTLVRSINTSLTTIIVLVALALFGGESIRHFILALIIGIITGTYSSIFVASPLLVLYERWKHRSSKT